MLVAEKEQPPVRVAVRPPQCFEGRLHGAQRRPRVSTPAPQQAAANVSEEKRIDWFIVVLYALMLSGIAVFSALAYMLFVPAV